MSNLVTLSDAKLHLRVSDTSEDSLIEDLIEAAEEWIIKFTNRTSLPDNADSPLTYPYSVKAAALLLIGDLYANREAVGDKTYHDNPTLMRLLYPYREEIGI